MSIYFFKAHHCNKQGNKNFDFGVHVLFCFKRVMKYLLNEFFVSIKRVESGKHFNLVESAMIVRRNSEKTVVDNR